LLHEKNPHNLDLKQIIGSVSFPAQNINRVFGPGSEPQRWMPPLLYVVILLMVLLPLLVYWPTHLLLDRRFGLPPANVSRMTFPD